VLRIQTKVAWNWLDKMLGRSQNEVSTNDIPEAQKEKVLDQVYRDLLAHLNKLQKEARDDVVKKAHRIAVKRGLSPVHLLYYLINGRDWPTMSGDMKRALQVMQGVFLHTRLPDGRRDEIDSLDPSALKMPLMELAIYISGRLIPNMSDSFFNEVEKQAKNVVSAFKQPGDRAQPRAFAGLVGAFEERLARDHFPGKTTVMRLLRSFQ